MNEENKIVYLAKAKRMSFTVAEIDGDGKPVPVFDPITGHHVRINGKPQHYEQTVTFQPVITSVSRGVLSRYVVDENTPEVVAKKLEELSKDGRSSVMTEENYIKIHNPEQFKEIERRKELEAKYKAEYEAKIAEAKEAGYKAAQGDIAALKQENSNLKGAKTKNEKALEEMRKQVAEFQKDTK